MDMKIDKLSIQYRQHSQQYVESFLLPHVGLVVIASAA